MRPRPRRSSRAGTPPVDPLAYPRLVTFFRGYLHEDFVVEHGDVDGALRAFRADLPETDRAELDDERRRLGAELARCSLPMVRRVLARTFQAGWWPGSLADVRRILPPAGLDPGSGPART